MKFIKRFFMVLISVFLLTVNTSCFAKAFEEEINVVFMYEDEYIAHDTVTQFKNIKSPELIFQMDINSLVGHHIIQIQ